MNVLLLASHAVAEYDDLRMFSDLGYDVFAPGGYEVPSRSGEGIRPPLPDAPHHPEFVALCEKVRAERGEPGNAIDWAKATIHPDIIDWADVIICHHFPDRWLGGQWDRIKHKRVIWRTCGQSDPDLERYMATLDGLQIVRYSPKERTAFGAAFAGQDALIRFGKYPDDYGPFIGDEAVVGNLTQSMVHRADATGLNRWLSATAGLLTSPAGEDSEAIGGRGKLSYQGMLDYLRHIRAYLYLGTKPAPYTLGLIEAMLSGVPVEAWPYELYSLWEANDILGFPTASHELVSTNLRIYLADRDYAADFGARGRRRAIELFGIETIGAQWVEFLR